MYSRQMKTDQGLETLLTGVSPTRTYSRTKFDPQTVRILAEIDPRSIIDNLVKSTGDAAPYPDSGSESDLRLFENITGVPYGFAEYIRKLRLANQDLEIKDDLRRVKLPFEFSQEISALRMDDLTADLRHKVQGPGSIEFMRLFGAAREKIKAGNKDLVVIRERLSGLTERTSSEDRKRFGEATIDVIDDFMDGGKGTLDFASVGSYRPYSRFEWNRLINRIA